MPDWVTIRNSNSVLIPSEFNQSQVVLPDLACLRIAVYEDSGRLLGHRVLPVTGLCPGYRHLSLRSDAGQPLNLSTLFVNIMVKGRMDFLKIIGHYYSLFSSDHQYKTSCNFMVENASVVLSSYLIWDLNCKSHCVCVLFSY